MATVEVAPVMSAFPEDSHVDKPQKPEEISAEEVAAVEAAENEVGDGSCEKEKEKEEEDSAETKPENGVEETDVKVATENCPDEDHAAISIKAEKAEEKKAEASEEDGVVDPETETPSKEDAGGEGEVEVEDEASEEAAEDGESRGSE